MKQIIPFQKELLFKTKVSEVTSISLEHTLSLKEDNLVSGEFHIYGDYKMTEGSINREKFDFNLPFEIALDDEYDMDSMVIDIDNFYYEVINNESMKVNIDVYVDGKKKVCDDGIVEEGVLRGDEIVNDDNHDDLVLDDDSIDSSIDYKKDDSYYLDDDDFHIFDNGNEDETYVTYYVYIVKENDTLDSIIEKFGVSMEDISCYNDINDFKAGQKLIIPNSNE